MNKGFKKAVLILGSAILNFAAGGVIYYFWQPIALWYWNYRPILGVDFYNTVSYVGYLARHFAFRVNGWKYIWFGGYPMWSDYPSLNAYLNLPLLTLFSFPQAVQVYMLICCFLFLFFSYFVFWEIGKNRILAVILTIASAFSSGLYGPLVWGGSLPYFGTQFFLPLTVWLLLKYFHTQDKRWFFLSSLFLGISFFGHPQVGLSYAIPIIFLMILTYPFDKEKFLALSRLKRLGLYFLVALLIGYPQLGLYSGTNLAMLIQQITSIPSKFLGGQKALPSGGSSADLAATKTAADIAQFQKNQLGRLVSETNPLFFIFLIAGILLILLAFILEKEKKKSFKTFVFALPALWIVFYDSLFAFGIGIFHGGWYRVFWSFPLALGILISSIWGNFWASIREKFAVLDKKFTFKLISILVSILVILIPGFFILSQNSAQKMLKEIELPLLRQQSSAFPDSLNVYIEKGELKELKKRLIPSWLDPDETQYRLYEADQRVNIWWNAFFDMPLVKGYIDPPYGDTSGGFYWLGIALTQSQGIDHLVKTWKNPETLAYNNALFLIDWYSVKYLEAEHEKSDSYNPPTSYLAKSDIFSQKEKVVVPGWAQLYAWKPDEPGPIVWHPNEEEYLTYYEIRDNLVSPIAHTTNASTIGVIGTRNAYQTVLRSLATLNLNSRNVIPLDLGQLIDNVSPQTLKDMEAIILYSYNYKNHSQSWAKLEKYIQEGGKVFIETGSEVKQTDSVNLSAHPRELPNIFPIKATEKREMGTEWRLSGEGSVETTSVTLESFGPPTLDEKPWLFSLPSSDEDLKPGARVILSDKGIPLVVAWQYGKGEVIWSGMNLPYHLTIHKNLEEAKFFENLLTDFVSLKPVDYSNFTAERQSALKVIITGSKAKGVFFREQDFPGWKSEINGKTARIYKAGPTYPGFMYVVIPEKLRESDFKVIFSFKGSFFGYFWTFVSLLIILILVDRIVFSSRLVTPILRKIVAPIGKKVGKWWEKEEEY